MNAEASSAKLAIVTIWYNREEEVENSILSLLKSSPDECVIYIVDDCSTDGTFRELSRLACNDSRVVLKSNDRNLGFTKTLQNTIEPILSNGEFEFIGIFGAGDRLLSGNLNSKIEAFESDSSLSLVTTRHYIVGSSITKSKFSGVIEKEMLFQGVKWTHGNVMYRAKFLKDAGGYDPEFLFSQDWDLYFRILENSKGICLDNCSYEKLVFSDGATYNPSKRYKQLMYGCNIISKYSSVYGRAKVNSRKVFVKRLRFALYRLFLHREFSLLSSWYPVLCKNEPGFKLLDLKFLSILSRLF